MAFAKRQDEGAGAGGVGAGVGKDKDEIKEVEREKAKEREWSSGWVVERIESTTRAWKVCEAADWRFNG